MFRGRWCWSTSAPALAWVRRADHLGAADVPLADAVRDLVAGRIGRRPTGPIRLLTHPRYAGYVFNPLSLFYCFDAGGERVEAVVADVTNTPWGERHQYVLAGRTPTATPDTRRAPRQGVSRLAVPADGARLRLADRPARADRSPSRIAARAASRRRLDGGAGLHRDAGAAAPRHRRPDAAPACWSASRR